MKRFASVALAASTLIGFGMISATPAQAVTSNVGGWHPGTATCPDGAVSVAPIIITNASAVTRTGSYSVPKAISDAVQVSSTLADVNCTANNPNSNFKAFGGNFTVAAGQTTVMWIGLGAEPTYQTDTESHNIGFGGLPSGSLGASWYDMGLTLNNAKTGFNGGNTFNNLTATYQYTGGTDLKTNNQDGFVLTSCMTMLDGSIYPSANILTPYNNGQWTQGPTYQANQPICAAWMPEGTYVPATQGPSTAFTVQAAQTYGPGYTSVAMAGSGTATITSASISINGGAAVTVPVGAASSGPWVGQEPATKQWFLANAVAPVGQSVALTLNGVVVGTASAGK